MAEERSMPSKPNLVCQAIVPEIHLLLANLPFFCRSQNHFGETYFVFTIPSTPFRDLQNAPLISKRPFQLVDDMCPPTICFSPRSIQNSSQSSLRKKSSNASTLMSSALGPGFLTDGSNATTFPAALANSPSLPLHRSPIRCMMNFTGIMMFIVSVTEQSLVEDSPRYPSAHAKTGAGTTFCDPSVQPSRL